MVPNSRLFNRIDPNDIYQGDIGNCYYLAALSALAEKPDLIKKLFKNNQGGLNSNRYLV